MALIKCPECGKDVSDKAQSCIHCGCPLAGMNPAGSVTVAVNGPGMVRMYIFDMETAKNFGVAETEKLQNSMLRKKLKFR